MTVARALNYMRKQVESGATNVLKPEELARFFHDTYERLAPQFEYRSRKETNVPWEQVPENNKQLMIATATAVLAKFRELK